MDKENVAKGDEFYMNSNNRKNAENHPDFVGKLMINQEQLRALIEIHERAREEGKQPVLQVDVSGWKGKSKNDGKPYLYCRHEVYSGPRKDPSEKSFVKTVSTDEDWL